MNSKRFLDKRIFIIIVILVSCGSLHYTTNCETTFFHFDNSQNDTSKFILENSFVYDTTANSIGGLLIDRVIKNPISGAIISLQQGAHIFRDTTDNKGTFEIMKNDFSGSWEMTIISDKYRCLQVKDVNMGGGKYVTLKLQPDNK